MAFQFFLNIFDFLMILLGQLHTFSNNLAHILLLIPEAYEGSCLPARMYSSSEGPKGLPGELGGLGVPRG
jgi:hypothetical protein